MKRFIHRISMIAILMGTLAVCVPAQSTGSQYRVAVIPDILQSRSVSVPAAIISILMTTDKEYKDKVGIKSGRLRNQSTNKIISVKLRWFSTTSEDREKREKVFGQGEIEPIEIEISGGQDQEIEITMPKMNEKLKKWMEENPSVNDFIITISVSEVVFEDGSRWKAETIK